MTSSITVRRPSFDLADLPRRWVGNSRLSTWFGNAGHVFIPLGEQMFIDSVRAYREQIDDDLRGDVLAFIGQEAVHARVHESVWDELRSHGVPVDAYARWIDRLRDRLEPHVPPSLLLATTAALEHYTAVLGRTFLEADLDAVIPAEMAALLRWHGAEELEHRSVAFAVLQSVDDRYATRVAGMAMATALLAAVPSVGIGMFAAAELRDPATTPAPRPSPLLSAIAARVLGSIVVEVARYLRSDFHPRDQPLPRAYDHWLTSSNTS